MSLCLFNHARPEVETTADGFALAEGARFVTKAEYEIDLPHRGMVFPTVLAAFVAAADDDGLLADFDVVSFFNSRVPAAMGLDPEDIAESSIAYDTFTAMVLMEVLFHLVEMGYLAQRGNGDSIDYRLALPGKAG